jgi:Arc/MetJ-type ribon-helix-helix transcriptional regulator
MEKLELDLPEDMAAFVEEVAGGALGSEEARGYLRYLIAEEMEKQERLRAELQKGLDSGLSPLSFDEIIERARERARSRVA